jgi:hypothetical protein
MNEWILRQSHRAFGPLSPHAIKTKTPSGSTCDRTPGSLAALAGASNAEGKDRARSGVSGAVTTRRPAGTERRNCQERGIPDKFLLERTVAGKNQSTNDRSNNRSRSPVFFRGENRKKYELKRPDRKRRIIAPLDVVSRGVHAQWRGRRQLERRSFVR